MWTDLVNGFGDLCTKFFKIMPMIGNSYNFLMITFGFIMFGIWMKMQADYNKKAKQDNTLP